MRFLIDENVPRSVGDFLAARGHDVVFSDERLGKGADDEVVALTGDILEAIVVTFDKDLKRLASRWNVSQSHLHRLGRISFTCREPEARPRIEELIDWIEFEYQQVQHRRDRRLIMQISKTSLTIIR